MQEQVAGKPEADCKLSETGTTERHVAEREAEKNSTAPFPRVFLHPSSPHTFSSPWSAFLNYVLCQIMEKPIFYQTSFAKFYVSAEEKTHLLQVKNAWDSPPRSQQETHQKYPGNTLVQIERWMAPPGTWGQEMGRKGTNGCFGKEGILKINFTTSQVAAQNHRKYMIRTCAVSQFMLLDLFYQHRCHHH